MTEHYSQNHTKEEIGAILQTVKACISAGRYIISQKENRQENLQLIKDYRLDSRRQKAILTDIRITDFCHSQDSTGPDGDETLYIFRTGKPLFNALGEREPIDIYVSFGIIDCDHSKKLIIVSFHKYDKTVSRLFG